MGQRPPRVPVTYCANVPCGQEPGKRYIRLIRVGRTAGIRLIPGIQMEHPVALANRQRESQNLFCAPGQDYSLTTTARAAAAALTRPELAQAAAILAHAGEHQRATAVTAQMETATCSITCQRAYAWQARCAIHRRDLSAQSRYLTHRTGSYLSGQVIHEPGFQARINQRSAHSACPRRTALHGACDGLLTFTTAPISRQLTRPYSRSMTDEAPPPQRGDELASQAGLRASHVDRDQAVELLRVAAGDGRLTAEELDERLEEALTARTCGELAALTTDLPAVPDSAPGAPVPEPKDLARIGCRGSSVKRDGRWLVPRRMEVRVTGGSVTLDFTEAVILQPSLLIDADVSASRLTLVTKPGVVVDTDEVAAEGSYVKVRAHRGPEVPIILRIQVSGKVSGGHITARPPRRTFWPWLRRHPQPHRPASP